MCARAKVKVDMAEKEKFQDREEHKRLAAIVKSIHADLRRKLRANKGDFEAVWSQHCQDQSTLSMYAESMKKLAQQHWTKNPQTRIHWCRDIIVEYFHQGGLKKALEKEKKRQKRELEINVKTDGNKGTKTVVNKLHPESETGEQDQSVLAGKHEAGNDSTDLNQEYSRSAESAIAEDRILDDMYPSLSVTGNSTVSVTIDSTRCHEDCQDMDTETNGKSERAHRTRKCEQSTAGEDYLYTYVQLPLEGKIRLLDVGSCYNPFLEFPDFLAVGVDISPATESVFRCDFLHLETTAPLRGSSAAVDGHLQALSNPVESLPACSFHVVVFCLLLEYLPAPYQRWLCCLRAFHLLQHHGLLVIITPDSHSQHRNAPMIRSWRSAIETLGFSRWRYVKQDHLHCMAFRKLSQPTESSAGFDGGQASEFVNSSGAAWSPDMMYIPQDFSDTSAGDETEEGEAISEGFEGEEDRQEFFTAVESELPGFLSEDSE